MAERKVVSLEAVMRSEAYNIEPLLQKHVRKWHLSVEERSKQLKEACRYKDLRHPGLHHEEEVVALEPADIRVATAGKQ